jgi:NAD(P)-dependent dehydrogenase (short-subunit alcohol dehydrogenase family)
MDLGIRGRVAIVTGASKGIGRATADALSEEGAAVLLSARGPDALAEAVEDLRSRGRDVAGCVADVSDPGSAALLRDQAVQQWGHVDIVVNNAGGGPYASDHVTDFDATVWEEIFRLNVTSAMRLTLACVGGMAERGWGRVVNVASTAGRDPDARFASYGACKAALLHATRTTALAYARQGVLVNAVLPGLTRSEGVLSGYADAAAASGRSVEEIEIRMMDKQPIAMGRTGEPAEVAGAIAFLCSEQASWMTGVLLPVDGLTIKAL